ncbi:hypothetical protein KSP40_PGU007516 [Platanthera guangdongensis]|uniref:Uncharacterized protein n=1 Tax=Platanthera guangdongensis TaxID=2320717 RepID=A0ABR2MAR4_9ASPA
MAARSGIVSAIRACDFRFSESHFPPFLPSANCKAPAPLSSSSPSSSVYVLKCGFMYLLEYNDIITNNEETNAEAFQALFGEEHSRSMRCFGKGVTKTSLKRKEEIAGAAGVVFQGALLSAALSVLRVGSVSGQKPLFFFLSLIVNQ